MAVGENNKMKKQPTGNGKTVRNRFLVLNFLLTAIFLVAASTVASSQTGLRWARGGSAIPANAIVGGQEANGRSLFICRTQHNGTTLPGKVVAGKCNYNWGTTEYASGAFEILVGTGGYWSREIDARTAIVGGSGGGQNYYICTAFTNNGSHPGRVQNGKCNYGFGGRGYSSTNFEVLNGGGAGGTAAAAVSLLDAALRGDAVSVASALKAGQAIIKKIPRARPH